MIEIGSPNKPKILLVDDEAEVLNRLSDLLRKDFHVFATTDPEQAQQLLIDQAIFSIVISDQRMPEISGSELLARVAKTSPDTARILLTGYSDLSAIIEAVNQGKIAQYITKPWDAEKLLAVLKPLAERHQLLRENHRLIEQIAELNHSASAAAVAAETLAEAQDRIKQENLTLKSAYEQLDKSFWHLKKIQEVLPICMECSKVKNGDSSWENVADFLKKNSLFLSHGYCPECGEKMLNRLKIKK
jgi:response regulator RpfG family c-di-GMP phosphodiesterase